MLKLPCKSRSKPRRGLPTMLPTLVTELAIELCDGVTPKEERPYDVMENRTIALAKHEMAVQTIIHQRSTRFIMRLSTIFSLTGSTGASQLSTAASESVGNFLQRRAVTAQPTD